MSCAYPRHPGPGAWEPRAGSAVAGPFPLDPVDLLDPLPSYRRLDFEQHFCVFVTFSRKRGSDFKRPHGEPQSEARDPEGAPEKLLVLQNHSKWLLLDSLSGPRASQLDQQGAP